MSQDKREGENLLAPLYNTFSLIVDVNLSANTYVIKKSNNSSSCNKEHEDFEQYLLSYLSEKKVYEADTPVFIKFSNLDKIRDHFSHSTHGYSVLFRKKHGRNFHWTKIILYAAEDYSVVNERVIMYEEDLSLENNQELEERRDLEYASIYDTLTSLNNFYSYKKFCTNFSNDKSKKHSVGVIFADLNGLKIINDTQGHNAGNEFIRKFTRLLKENFPDSHNFRISGDEFLVIFIDTPESEFLVKTSQFYDILQSHKIPEASLGWSYKKHANYIENTVKDAEVQMYEDKHLFYVKHPEFKRGALEQTFQNEINGIINILSESLKTLYIIDLEKNAFHMYKHEKLLKNEGFPLFETYTELNEYYINNYTAESFIDLRKNSSSIEYLTDRLSKKDFISTDYMLKDGSWRQICFKKLTSNGGKPAKVIMYSIIIDKDRAEILNRTISEREELSIIQGLRTDYSTIMLIDTKKRTIDIKYSTVFGLEYLKSKTNIPYAEIQEWFTKKFVSPEDQETFLFNTNLSYVQKRLKEKNTVEVYAITTPELHNATEKSYSRIIYFSSKDKNDRIVLATQNITEMIRKTLSYIDESL